MEKQTRREFLKAIGTGAVSAGAVSIFPGDALAASTPAAKGKPPNFLVIMSDEHNAGVTGCYGNKTVHTPSLDALARRGIVFENCYCNSPLCVPRASLLLPESTRRASGPGITGAGCQAPTTPRCHAL